MCGICGIYHTEAVSRETDEVLVGQMVAALAHRGPDDSGIWQDCHVSLGSRRLSVIDLSPNGHMPMSNEDGSVWLVFNGEIYNFRELKESFALSRRGHVFRSHTDSEVLLHLYEELGPEMVAHLDGMFAFAIWDARKQELHLFRDRFGIKPLFYTWQGNRLLFASEIKSLLLDSAVPRRVNLQALHDFLTFDYIPGAQTAFAGIFELPPAHRMVVDSQCKERIVRYWNFSFDVDESIDEERAVREVRERLSHAVKRQLIADVPVGVLLSGGMDSSALLALMKPHTSAPIHTYSVGFEDSSYNELPYARLVAKSLGAISHEVTVTADLVRDLLPNYLRYIDEPYADGSAVATYYVCQLAKGEVVVLLSGEGGDEIFAGYDTHAAYQAAEWFRRVPRWMRQGFIAPLVNALPVSDKKLSLEFRMKRFLGGVDLAPAEAHMWWRIVLTEAQKRKLYTTRVLEQLNGHMPERHFLNVFKTSSAKDTLNRLLEIDSSVFLPDDLMIKNDRMSMAHSIEARVPMTDNELVEFMSRVPARLKISGLHKKRLLRKAMHDLLPPTIVNKKKVGLEIPYSPWLRKELRDVLMKYCNETRVADTGLFRPESVQSLIFEHVEGRHDHGRALWGLLNFMMWHDLYIA